MSNVRLSNGSPTLERTDSGRVSGAGDHHPKPSACRSLFGAVDHEELRRDLKGHLRGMEEAASARWNFDFANHAPLATGRFDWEIVDCRDVPDFYSRTQQQQHRGGAAAAGATVAVGVCSNKRQQQRTAAVAGNNNVDVNGNHSKCVVLVGQGTNGGSTTVGQGTTGASTDRASDGLMECGEQCTGGGQRKRPACHESTAQNKRSHTSSDEVHCPNMTLSSELTPRKSSPRRQT